MINIKEQEPVSFFSKVNTFYVRYFLRRNFNRYHSFLMAKNFSKQVDAQIQVNGDYDVLLVPGNSLAIAFLETDIPIIQLTDANFAAMNNYYPSFTD